MAQAAARAKNFFIMLRFFMLGSSNDFDFRWQMTGRFAKAAGEVKAKKKAFAPIHGTKAAASAIPPKLT